MPYVFCNDKFTRKVTCIKNQLKEDGFYDGRLLTRVVSKTGTSGLYNRNVTITHCNTVVSGIIVYRAEYPTYDEQVQTIYTDTQFTCRAEYKDIILAADELWLDYTLAGSLVTDGTMYKVKSSKPTLFGVDYIFNLVIAGKQNA